MNARHGNDRQSGRTTRMLLAACIAVSDGKDILLVGHNAEYSRQLARQLHVLLDGIGIPHEAEQVRWKSALDVMPDGAMEVFVDHYAEEVA